MPNASQITPDDPATATIAAPSPRLIQRGIEPYQTSFDAMRAFTDARDATTPDELWIVEHPPVFTLGLGADRSHVLAPHKVPVIQTDRGGEVTYHGPGQVVIYLLMDLRRNHAKGRLFAREFVNRIEQAVINTLAAYNLAGERKAGAPGIYLANGQWQGAKIAALGLKVRGNGCTYHGVSLNVAMDLAPFSWINPCGYAGLATVDMRTVGQTVALADVQLALAHQLQHLLIAA
jgi:lipoyl(octanoyl) transferase